MRRMKNNSGRAVMIAGLLVVGLAFSCQPPGGNQGPGGGPVPVAPTAEGPAPKAVAQYTPLIKVTVTGDKDPKDPGIVHVKVYGDLDPKLLPREPNERIIIELKPTRGTQMENGLLRRRIPAGNSSGGELTADLRIVGVGDLKVEATTTIANANGDQLLFGQGGMLIKSMEGGEFTIEGLPAEPAGGTPAP